MKVARKKEAAKRAKEIIAEVVGGGEEIVKQNEVYMIGKYDENETRPMKIKFMLQTAVEHVLQRHGKFAKQKE